MNDIKKAVLKVAKANPKFARLLKAELQKESYARLYGSGKFWVRCDKIVQWQEWVGYVDEERDRSDSYFHEVMDSRDTLWIARSDDYSALLDVVKDNNLKIPRGKWKANVWGGDFDTKDERKKGRVTVFRLAFGTGNAQGEPSERIKDQRAFMGWAHHLGAKLNRKKYKEEMEWIREDEEWEDAQERARVAQKKTAGGTWWPLTSRPVVVGPRRIKKTIIDSQAFTQDYLNTLDFRKVEFDKPEKNPYRINGTLVSWRVFPKGSYGDKNSNYVRGYVMTEWKVGPKGIVMSGDVTVKH